jgi:hypothetical protein
VDKGKRSNRELHPSIRHRFLAERISHETVADCCLHGLCGSCVFADRSQDDWVRTNNYKQGRNEFRFAAGIVVNLPPIGKS